MGKEKHGKRYDQLLFRLCQAGSQSAIKNVWLDEFPYNNSRCLHQYVPQQNLVFKVKCNWIQSRVQSYLLHLSVER